MLIDEWIGECCELGPHCHARITKLYKSYVQWIERQDDQSPYLVKTWFMPRQGKLRDELLSRGIARIGGRDVAPHLIGIALKT